MCHFEQTDLQRPARAQAVNTFVRWQGVLALHSHKPPILHRDLKSPNLLIDKHWRCKIADFNLSRVMVRAAQLLLPAIFVLAISDLFQMLLCDCRGSMAVCVVVKELAAGSGRAEQLMMHGMRRTRPWCRPSWPTTRAGWRPRSSCTRHATAFGLNVGSKQL